MDNGRDKSRKVIWTQGKLFPFAGVGEGLGILFQVAEFLLEANIIERTMD